MQKNWRIYSFEHLVKKFGKLKVSQRLVIVCSYYHIAGKFGGGKFGEFDESFMIHQTKTIQITTHN